MIENLEILTPGAVRERVHQMYDQGYRYVTMTCCTNADNTFDIFYSFDLVGKMLTLKTTVAADETVQSVSDIYLAAAFAENEIDELFGVKIEGKAIDYGGHFLLSEGAPESPFGQGVIIEKKGGK